MQELNSQSVEPDRLLIAAGECFMHLLWIETVMRDLVVLREGGENMRRRYSAAFGKDPHPSDFSTRRMELGTRDFGVVKGQFLEYWPEWRDDAEVHDAIERVVIWRNALGHANVQPFREFLLYTPADSAWKRIQRYTRCHKCFRYLVDCGCDHDDVAEPHSMTVRLRTLQTIYLDIRTVDVSCFYPVAVSMDVAYQGFGWLTGDGGYLVREHRPSVLES